MLNKVKRKLAQKYQQEMGKLSEGTTNLILQRDLMKRQYSYSKAINEAFDYFMKNYLLVLDYLEYDFGQNKVYDPSGKDKSFKDDIKFERSVLIEQQVKFTGIMNRSFMKYTNPKKMANTTRMWLMVNQFLKCYPILLSQLEDVSGMKVHKDMNIDKELEKIEEYRFLEEDFYSIIKSIKKDTKK